MGRKARRGHRHAAARLSETDVVRGHGVGAGRQVGEAELARAVGPHRAIEFGNAHGGVRQRLARRGSHLAGQIAGEAAAGMAGQDRGDGRGNQRRMANLHMNGVLTLPYVRGRPPAGKHPPPRAMESGFHRSESIER